MNLFKKLLGKKEAEFTPDNSVLLELIQAYHQNETPENYKKVIEELYGPRAFLVVPYKNSLKYFMEGYFFESSRGYNYI